MLGLLVKKSDYLYVHLRYDLLDGDGFFKEDKAYYRIMLFTNSSETRIFHERCNRDKDAEEPTTEAREGLFVK